MSAAEILKDYADKGSFNGSALVADKGRVIHKAGYGLANAEWEIANTPATVFRIGSLTKQFTAMLVMVLASQGKFSLEDCITDCLPWYRPDTGSRITIHNLLTHSSGIPTFTTLEFIQNHLRSCLPVKEFARRFCSGDLEFLPGTAFTYSNSGYHILGAIIEEVTGLSYARAMTQYVLAPLGLKDTGYDESEKIVPRRAAGYDREEGSLRNTSFVDMSIPYAGGGLYSTVEDYFAWDRALARGDLLPKQYYETMFTPVHGNYACGWGIARVAVEDVDEFMQNPSGYRSREEGVLFHRHEGGINGFHTLAVRVPQRGGLIVLFSNMGEAPLSEMAGRILREMYNC